MSPTAQITSLSLLDGVRRGEAAAWDRFANIYVPLVYRWAKEAHLQEHDARDVSQEVFLSVVRGLPRFKTNEAGHGLRAWLRTITKNAVIDVYRRQRRQVGHSWILAEEPAESAPESEHIGEAAAERQLLLSRALDAVRGDFEPATWEMFQQLAAEELSAQEIAAQRNVSVWTVYKARSRVLARLREALDGYFPATSKSVSH